MSSSFSSRTSYGLRASFGIETDKLPADAVAKERAAAARLAALAATVPPSAAEEFAQDLESFTYNYRRFLISQKEKLDWNRVQTPSASMLRKYEDLPPCSDIRTAL